MLLKIINCKHHDNGCSLGLFGGKPSAGVCAICTDRSPKDPEKPAVETVELPTAATARAQGQSGAVVNRPRGCGGCSRAKR